MSKITLEGVDYTPVTLMALLQSGIDAADAAATARAAWLLAVQKQHALITQLLGVLLALKAYVALNFGSGAVDTQADFGFSPKKKVVKTAEQKASAAAKAQVTRAWKYPTAPPVTVTSNGATATGTSATPAATPTNPTPAAIPQVPVTPKS